LTGLRPSAIAQRGIVRTFQRTSVFPALSVEDNVLTGLHLRGTARLFEVLAGRRRLAAAEKGLVAGVAARLELVRVRPRRAAGAPPPAAWGGAAPCPAASGGSSSWRLRSRHARACCCSTSRAPA